MIYTLSDGEEVGIRISFSALYKVRENHKDAYQRYNDAKKRLYAGQVEDDFDYAQIIYIGYLCEKERERFDNMAETDGAMPFLEFLEKMPDGMVDAMTIATELISPKKKRASVMPSKSGQKNSTGA